MKRSARRMASAARKFQAKRRGGGSFFNKAPRLPEPSQTKATKDK